MTGPAAPAPVEESKETPAPSDPFDAISKMTWTGTSVTDFDEFLKMNRDNMERLKGLGGILKRNTLILGRLFNLWDKEKRFAGDTVWMKIYGWLGIDPRTGQQWKAGARIADRHEIISHLKMTTLNTLSSKTKAKALAAVISLAKAKETAGNGKITQKEANEKIKEVDDKDKAKKAEQHQQQTISDEEINIIEECAHTVIYNLHNELPEGDEFKAFWPRLVEMGIKNPKAALRFFCEMGKLLDAREDTQESPDEGDEEGE